MTTQQITSLVILAASAVFALCAFFWRHSRVKALALIEAPTKQDKKKTRGPTILLAACGWLFAVELLTLVFGPKEKEEFGVALFAPRMQLFGFEISSTVVITWSAMAIILILALLLRIFLIPRMKDKPTGLQNVLELCVSGVSDYTSKQTGGQIGDNLSAYLFSLALLMVVSAVIELFGLRPPTADVTMTFAMALITFVLINYYGFKKKGVGGRIKSLGQPNPVIFPIKILSDIAVPVSLACRLFGNMLGGMIVIDLLYYALGNFGVAIPSVAGLYFNVFHPLIQIFIFVTLSLTFINEAVE